MVVFDSNFWAAIVGAIVGGGIAAGLQMLSTRTAKKERDVDRTEVRVATAHAVLFKTIRIYSNLHALDIQVKECFEEAAAAQFEGPPWTILRPVANPLDRMHFSPEEMSLVVSLGQDELTNAMLSIDLVHNRAIDVLALYSARRAALLQQLPAQMDGILGRTVLSEEEALRLGPQVMETNQLAEYVRDEAPKDDQNSRAALVSLQAALKHKFGLKFSLKLPDEPAAAA